MPKAKIISLEARHVQSLVWHNDNLIDWVDGAVEYFMDGRKTERHVSYAYPFDSAVSSPSGEYSVIYTRLGTKGLVLKNGRLIREINRSFYHADVYEYPIALVRLKNGREAIAHCPEDYCQIDIDDLETGARLTAAKNRKSKDFFHSRLSVSSNGKYLLSAGWIWHPVDAVQVYDIEAALLEPSYLDGDGLGFNDWADDGVSATFLPGNQIAISVVGLEHEDGEVLSKPRPDELRVYDLTNINVCMTAFPSARIGTMMAVGADHVLGLHQHPKLFELTTGRVIREWPDVQSGTQVSSIMTDGSLPPPIAFDPLRQRCAIASEERIVVLQFDA